MSTKVDISKLQAVAVQQLAVIRQLHASAAMRALLVGLTLHRIKVACKHGEFRPWLAKNFDGGKSTANHYMRLALVFVEKMNAQRPELLALPGDQIDLALEKPGAAEKRLMDKAAKFVGDKTLSELLDEHGIRETGKRSGTRATEGAGGETGSEDDQEQTVQERFNEIEKNLRLAVVGVKDKATWMTFSKQQHRTLKTLFTDAANDVDAIFLKTHGRDARN
jgi:hypothetical protein